jgi:hypothetical protein
MFSFECLIYIDTFLLFTTYKTGIFAASMKSIYRQDMKVWKALQMALERGNNIQEGHYAERR